jgi:Domain of unknown function (DUF1905)
MKNTHTHTKHGALDVAFRARLLRSRKPGGWTYVVWPESVAFFGTRGLVKVEGLIDGIPFRSSFMPLGDGRHMLPVKEQIRSEIGKHAGDTVRVELQARLS